MLEGILHCVLIRVSTPFVHRRTILTEISLADEGVVAGSIPIKASGFLSDKNRPNDYVFSKFSL